MSAVPDRLGAALADRYRIERELGAGGMATVYLAEDLRHDRKVAIKVLKPELAAVLGAERFVVEIKTTAALSHPHILPLFDSGTADGFLYYVMPFIKGETIREKLNRETQFGVDEAVRIAREVADALDYAHRNGVIHRDIKPENILLHDGRAMVMDFGIALAVSAAAGGRMTETGLSLGTPHYMSPEQATADKEITPRSDIYSLASVLYEMLAGQPPHVGGAAQQVIMKIITEPAQRVTAMRRNVPPNVAAALAKALEKLPADRFESAKAFSDALGNPAFQLEGAASTNAPTHGTLPRGAFAGMTGLAIVASVAAVMGWLRSPPVPPAAPPTRYDITLLDDAVPGGLGWRSVTLSADGRFIAFPRGPQSNRLIWLKSPAKTASEPVAGTEGGLAPSFSSDGEWIAFLAGGRLRKVRRDGGGVTTMAEAQSSGIASTAWLDDGSILFSGPDHSLSVVDADGSTRVLISRDSLPNDIYDIAAVPGSRTALVVTCSSNCAEAELWAVNLRSGTRRRLSERAIRAWFVSGGIVVFAENNNSGRVLAAPYDEKNLSLAATPVPVFEGAQLAGGETIQLAVAENGTLLYNPARTSFAQPVWVSREGNVEPVDSAWSFPGTNYVGGRVSPDGRRMAVVLGDGASADIWLKDLTGNGRLTRLTSTGWVARPEWTSDGESVSYANIRVVPGPWEIYQRRIDGTDSGRVVFRSTRGIGSFVRLRDTSMFIVRAGPPPTRDILLGRRGTSAASDTLLPLLASDQAEETAISLSPDERWLAYAENRSGRSEVIVVPFPDVRTGRWQISTEGGRSPRWSRSGNELFFRDMADGLVVVPVTHGTRPVFGERRLLFRLRNMRGAGWSTDPFQVQFDLSHDDKRFLFTSGLSEGNERRVGQAVLVQNWLTELRERMRRTP